MKIFIALIVIGLILAGFWFMDYQQKYTEIQQLDQNLKQSEEKLSSSKAKLQDLPRLTEEMQALERELQSLIASKFTNEDPELFVANYIADIERLVLAQQQATGDATFSIDSIQPGQMQTTATPDSGNNADQPGGTPPPGQAPPPADQPDAGQAPEALQGFPTRVFSMTMSGHYGTLVDFLYQLGALKLDRLVTINKISLSPTKDKERGDTLNIQIPITAYLRQGG
jgi:Tfp pilus assembly protein PilO